MKSLVYGGTRELIDTRLEKRAASGLLKRSRTGPRLIHGFGKSARDRFLRMAPDPRRPGRIILRFGLAAPTRSRV